MDENTLFVCPTCKGALCQQGGEFSCEKGHRYDLARQGYLHLLPANKMHSKIPGDTKEMVAARRAFLERGYYDIFRDCLCGLLQKYPCPILLDAGCGEGYYTGGVKAAIPQTALSGFDISKAAVKSAAGKYKDISFAVASIFDIPVADASFDGVINIFAPIVENEFRRILKKGGILIIAVPGKRHLWEMKEILYEQPYENEEKDTCYPGFTLLERIPVREKIHLPDPETIWNLFSMTPYFWKTGIAGSQKLKNTKDLTVEIGFDFLVYKLK